MLPQHNLLKLTIFTVVTAVYCKVLVKCTWLHNLLLHIIFCSTLETLDFPKWLCTLNQFAVSSHILYTKRLNASNTLHICLHHIIVWIRITAKLKLLWNFKPNLNVNDARIEKPNPHISIKQLKNSVSIFYAERKEDWNSHVWLFYVKKNFCYSSELNNHCCLQTQSLTMLWFGQTHWNSHTSKQRLPHTRAYFPPRRSMRTRGGLKEDVH